MKKSIYDMIDSKKYQVFLMGSYCTIPAIFAIHPWFIINNKWTIERWEVLVFKGQCSTSWWHLHCNALDINKWINIFPFFWPRWWEKILWSIDWDIAQKMIASIQQSPQQYPYNNKYKLLWPNSNSYIEWFLKKFSDSWLKLPWNSIGKNYKF